MPAALPTAYPTAPALPADVVVFGEALVDLFPETPGQPLEDVERFVRHLGGAPANFAVCLARQDVQVALHTLVGPDAFGRFVQKKLAAEGVVTDGIGTHKSARTGVTFVSLPGRGERAFLFYRHPSADMLVTAADLDAARLARGRLFHFGSSTLSREPSRAATLRALELATRHRAQKLVSCDVNLRPHLWAELKEAPPLLRKLLAGCDIVKLVPEELPLLFGTESTEAGAAKARQLGATVVAVTLGERGSYIDCPAGQAYLAAETAAGAAIPLVDPTGAGDAFMAGLVSGLLGQLGGPGPDDLRERLRGLSMAQVKRAAVRGGHLGARACTALGATTAVPKAPPQ